MTPDRRIVVTEDDLGPAIPPEGGSPPGAAEQVTEGARAAATTQAAGAASAGGLAQAAGAISRAGIGWLPVGVAALVATVVIGVSVVVVVKPFADPTAADFCKALRHGAEDIRSHIPNTQPRTAEESLVAIAAAFGNVGRYESMLDDLVDNSPKEIHNDMKTSRDTFKESIDAVPGGVSDPLGAIVGIVFKSLIHQPSFQHVDAYSQRHCGSTVFGTSAS